MQGLMMERPLLISGLLEHAAAVHGDRDIVSYAPEEPIYRGCYRATAGRVRQLANALRTLGVRPGDRVATLACSTRRHLEVLYAVSGIAAVCHTVNPRLHAEQLAWILNHAEDAVLFVDLAFLSQTEAALGGAGRVRQVVLMTDRTHMPEAAPDALLVNTPCYEELLARQADDLGLRRSGGRRRNVHAIRPSTAPTDAATTDANRRAKAPTMSLPKSTGSAPTGGLTRVRTISTTRTSSRQTSIK